MIKPMQATSDGDAYESNDVEGIWTAGISLPFRPESIFSRSMDPVWSSRIECHGESKEDAEELRDAVLTAITQPEAATHRSDGSDWLDYGVTPADHERRARHFAAMEGADANLRQAAQTVIDRFLPDKREYIFSKRIALEKLAVVLAKLPAPVEPVPYIELALYEGDKETQYPGYHRVRIPYDVWSWEIDHNGLLTNRIDIVFPQTTGDYYKAPLTNICAWIDGKGQMIQLSRALALGPAAITPVFKTGQLALATENPQHD